MTEMSRAPSGSASSSTRLPAHGASLLDLAPRRSRGSPCAARAGGSARARAPRARSAPMHHLRSRTPSARCSSRSKCAWLRGSLTRAITLLDAVLLARELADDDVVLVVAGHGDDDVRRAARSPRARARTARSRRRAAPGARTPPRAARSGRGAARSSVTSWPRAEQRPREVRADLAAAGDDRRTSGSRPARAARTRSVERLDRGLRRADDVAAPASA